MMKFRLGTLILAAGLMTAAALAQHGGGGAPATPAPAPTTQETPAGPPPKLTLSAAEWDFGTKWFGEPAEGEISISNTGKGPLRINKIISSCGCTVAKPKDGSTWEGKVVEPGASAAVALTYNTKKGAKKVSQTITIESNDPEQPRMVVQVKGEVKNVYSMTPNDRVTLGRLERDSKQTTTIEMTNNMDQAVPLKLKPNTTKGYEFKFEEVTPGKAYRLTVSTVPPLTQGSLATELVFETGLPTIPEIKVPVQAFVVPRVSVTPPKLIVTPKLTQPFQRIVRVNYSAAKPIKIIEVKSSDPAVKAEVMPPKTPTPAAANMATLFHEIKVMLPGAAEFPKDGVKLEITTDDADEEYKKLTVDIVMQQLPPSVPASINVKRQGSDGPGKSIPVRVGEGASQPAKPEKGGEDDDN